MSTFEPILPSQFPLQLPALQIPLDYTRKRQKDTFMLHRFDLGATIANAIHNMESDLQRQSVLLAAYVGWIHRMSFEYETAVLFASDKGIVPVHISFEQTPAFQTVVQQVYDQLVTAQPGQRIQSETVFSFGQTIPAQAGQLINWTIESQPSSLIMVVEYNDSLFKPATIARFSTYYIRLLEGLLNDPTLSVGAIDILNDEDKVLYSALNHTATSYNTDMTYHGAFEAAVLQYPNHTAVSYRETTYSYTELNDQANQIAHLLIQKGLQKGEFVTMFLDRSLYSVISLFGIMKAGGVYVPVDPAHPNERNHYIVQDTRSAFVITQPEHYDKVHELTAGISTLRGVLSIESLVPTTSANLLPNPQTGVGADDLAYVIYTSGSTGKPKGALIGHRGVINLGHILTDYFHVVPEDVMAQFASYSFDASVLDTIAPLFNGAHMYMLDNDERVSIEEFALAVERTGTTVVTALPTVFFNQLSAYLSPEGYERLSKLRLLAVAGEAMYGERVRAFQKNVGASVHIVNVYGPTECTVCTTLHTVSEPLPEHVVNVPLGRPINNYEMFIVNDEYMPCPVGVPGEVYIATVGLAKGYLNQPEKTDAAFIAHPYVEGAKIYRSGDLAKLLPDGTVEYVGRRDSQVKIRGHRIEIGEIEDNLNKYPTIQDAVVVAKKDASEQNMIVAYFTTQDGTTLSPAAIKQFLADRLPSYFVPKFVCQLDAIPLSPTGKAERKRLINYPNTELSEQPAGYVAPQTATQQQIAQAWSQVLNRELIGIEDDFFAIGGDSLHVIHVLSLLKSSYPMLKIGDFFDCKTVAALAVRAEQPGNAQATLLPFVHAGEVIELDEYPVQVASYESAQLLPATGVLLTGATGYLGSYLLHELLLHSKAHIYALVRKTGTTSSTDRLKSTMELYFGRDILTGFDDRVTVIEGNLDQPQIGLSADDYERLQQQMDAIIHCAADVRHFGDSDQFRKTNIQSTDELLKLAGTRTGIRFHYISTMGIPEDLSLEGKWQQVQQTGQLPEQLYASNVYTNSKLEAEKLVIRAAQQGIAVNIYRAGNLSSHSITGSFQRNIDSNAVYRMIKAILLLGKAPSVEQWMDFTPIDYAARSIVHLALQADTAGRIFHICNPQQIPYSELMTLIQQSGYPVEQLHQEEYRNWLLDSTVNKPAEAIQLAMAQLEGDGARPSPFRYANPLTTQRLEQDGITCVAPDLNFIRAMLSYAASIGYFPTPVMLSTASFTASAAVNVQNEQEPSQFLNA
ncbi:amino acid adenylation domain-containing protein [Paenibacillus campi]|uniref:non-ribosomal peptide synthetase family protein n=1 Tax=Paenibacillus campi TaxID=3106031 RepID=UPI002AFE5DE0|nr:amino acid adenylation domain-containing protein [Paenibacillus sp. SGZ-1014]